MLAGVAYAGLFAAPRAHASAPAVALRNARKSSLDIYRNKLIFRCAAAHPSFDSEDLADEEVAIPVVAAPSSTTPAPSKGKYGDNEEEPEDLVCRS